MSSELHKKHKARYQAQKYIAKNLRLLRTIRGLNQSGVADMLNMSRSYYSSLESGGKLPDFITLCTLSDFYGVNLDYLLGFDISGHFSSLLSCRSKELEAGSFAKKYLRLSHEAKYQVRKRVAVLMESEKDFNHYPWNYDGKQEPNNENKKHI